MARKPREHSETGLYHIIMRGNNKENIFFDDNDRYYFIKKMKFFSKKENISIYCYCLMSNHVHILIGNANKSISKFVQRLSLSYVRMFNRKYECSGHLFQGRFKSEPIKTNEQYKITYRYILQNPEKALISDFRKYKWSSFSTLFNKSTSFIDIKTIYDYFENESEFIKFISQKNHDKILEYENMPVINDTKCINLICRLLNISNPLNLIQLSTDKQKEKLSLLKTKGIPINQLSRLTGISRYIIKSA